MCLTYVGKQGKYLERKNKLPKFGWKVFKVRDKKIYSGYQGKTDKEYRKNIWLKTKDFDNDKRTKFLDANFWSYQKKYLKGFHIFLNKECAFEWADNYNKIVKKVYFKNVTTIGYQSNAKCIVVNQMKIAD